jgi:hypothetical protein
MTRRADNPWELADWQRDLVSKLPEDEREAVTNAFYYFEVVGSSSRSFFTHLLVLLGAVKYWSEDFPKAIDARSTEAAEKIRESSRELLERLDEYTATLEELSRQNTQLQQGLSKEQRQLNQTLNSVWTRIASQLSNRRFIQDLGEDLGRVLISSQDRVRPQIEQSYQQLEAAVNQTTLQVQTVLRQNSQELERTMRDGAQNLHDRWENLSVVLESDLRSAEEAKLELARTHRELRKYALQIDQFNRRAYMLAMPVLLALGLVLGFILAFLLFRPDAESRETAHVAPPAPAVAEMEPGEGG